MIHAEFAMETKAERGAQDSVNVKARVSKMICNRKSPCASIRFGQGHLGVVQSFFKVKTASELRRHNICE